MSYRKSIVILPVSFVVLNTIHYACYCYRNFEPLIDLSMMIGIHKKRRYFFYTFKNVALQYYSITVFEKLIILF